MRLSSQELKKKKMGKNPHKFFWIYAVVVTRVALVEEVPKYSLLVSTV